MYLQSLALVDTRVVPNVVRARVFMRAIQRKPKSELEREGDIWRNEPDKYNCVDLPAMISLVDKVLTQALVQKMHVEITLVEYIK